MRSRPLSSVLDAGAGAGVDRRFWIDQVSVLLAAYAADLAGSAAPAQAYDELSRLLRQIPDCDSDWLAVLHTPPGVGAACRAVVDGPPDVAALIEHVRSLCQVVLHLVDVMEAG